MNIEEIRARLAVATPGPWELEDGWGRIVQSEGHARCRAIWDANEGDPLYDAEEPEYVVYDGPGPAMNKQADSALIAHAPADMAYLLGEVDRLRGKGVEVLLAFEESVTQAHELRALDGLRQALHL